MLLFTATKIPGLSNPDQQERIIDFQDKKRKELEETNNYLVNEKK
jgi:5-(carboxyamino)imidazole ribonucleotide mutase